MRFRELRAVLQHVVLVGLPACTGITGRQCETNHREVTVTLPGDPPMQLRAESCRVDVGACPDLCDYVASSGTGGSLDGSSCRVTFDAEHAYVSFDTYSGCGTGRMPAGLAIVARRGGDAGEWLAHAAWLEAASVPAFVFLARELQAHGAPHALIAAALAAARDEVRHAALVASLARRYGANPIAPDVAPYAPRSLEAVAIENAVEGCVRETWGTVLALWQARTALDPEVRRAFAAIAEDELRHAALGWRIDRWARTRLDAAAIARVASARALAARALLEAAPDRELAVLGLPDEREQRALRARLHAAVWAGGVA